ncbi:ATP-dependent helicase HrpB [Paenibacillus sp. FSL A5-0031]|uniref:ATP-dependent helicase HrpB n=1 Tax=Paenibacillus sp. FSL A5-0031 TaxID=1920420 RepID=UPI00096CB387|nr:ATP-dependent helicase HrpB [Paenibacillus sp. FSL A5-0031]OME80140.1 ATP-dependent helicase HrpB [Paenibacillus sp. FSL A5-0031]
MNQQQLPIDQVLPELLLALQSGVNAVLIAEPGAGKTTRVPLALLDQPWLGSKKIIMLEPRRLAARSAAQFMAKSLGEQAGETVGYRVRLDSRVSSQTRIEVVTEGVLTRMLQEDPALEQVGAILFDEFHERHLHGDLGLTLCLQSQQLLRDDLRLVIMSATLDAEPIAELLEDAPIISSEGRVFPVETQYMKAKLTGPIEPHMAQTIMEALRSFDGDVLAFLPGVAEIRRTARWLMESSVSSFARVEELHGSLPLEKQDAAVAPCADGERKVVLATSIAESSLTVEGVKVVVDSGLMRVPRFSPRTGMTRLETLPVSIASADQRRGRAGRLAKGACYRLWTEQEHLYLPKQSTPELLEADLAALALELAIWGIKDPQELNWLTPPPAAAYEQAVALLKELNAIDGDSKPTAAGVKMAQFGLHPRLGAMILHASELGSARLACDAAALLSERDLLPQERNVDVQLRLDLLYQLSGKDGKLLKGGSSEHPSRGAVRRVIAQADQWERKLSAQTAVETASEKTAQHKSPIPIGILLAFAYPDRIAQRRSDGRYLLANGRGAVLPELQPLSRSAYLAACELDDTGSESRIRLAAELHLSDIEHYLSSYITAEEVVEWDAAAQAVRARKRLRLGSIVMKESILQKPDEQLVADALISAIQETGFVMLPMSKQAQQLKARMKLMALAGDDWPDASDEELLGTLDEWLKPHLFGMKSRADLQKLSMLQLLEGKLSWKQKQELDEQVPTHIVVPSGSRIPIDYSDPESPVLAVRLQELFGLTDTPRLARGRLPVTLHLLSPSQRPVQVTRDLRSFWENTYFEVKKDLKGRYPKHYWPDDPYTAMPTNRAKPRNT